VRTNFYTKNYEKTKLYKCSIWYMVRIVNGTKSLVIGWVGNRIVQIFVVSTDQKFKIAKMHFEVPAFAINCLSN